MALVPSLPSPLPAVAPGPPGPPPARGRPGPPWPVAGIVAVLVVLLHGMVLSTWPEPGDDGPPRPAGGLRLRAIRPAPVVQPPDPSPPPALRRSEPASRPPAGAAPRVEPVPATVQAPPAEAPLVAAQAEAPASAPVAQQTEVPPTALAAADGMGASVGPTAAPDLPPPAPLPPAGTAELAEVAAAAASAPTGLLPLAENAEPLPVYATRPAPSQTLSYQLRRGLLGGSAVLDWQRGEPGAPYRIQLVARAAGFVLMTQESEGRIDATGLVPRRFTDQRLRGSTRAANFQPERGRIGFSGPSVEYAWAPGVQDRLSWMLQLPAIVDANPGLAAPGGRITLAVIGARGDAAVWVFRFVADEPVTVAAGERRALKFIREPRKPHDTQAEVWLDPDHHHLPLRARIGNPPDGEVLDLVREAP